MNETINENGLIFVVNRNYLFALSEFLVNIETTNPRLFDGIVVYHSDLNEEDIAQLQTIDSRLSFQKYTLEMFENDHGKVVGEQGLKFISRYSHMPLARYRIFEQLNRFKRILCLDLDMLILDDISELFELKGIAWRNTVTGFEKKFVKFCDINRLHEFTKLATVNWKVPNGGLIYISGEDVDWRECLESGRKFISNFMNYFRAGIDEMVFSWITYVNNIHLTTLDKNIYNTPPMDTCFETKIVHFMNKCKIWNNRELQTLYPEWAQNYKISSTKGEFIHSAVVLYEKPCTDEILYEALWKELLSSKKFAIPKDLKWPVDCSKRVIQIYYSDTVFFEITGGILKKDFSARLIVRSVILLHNASFLSEISQFVKEYGLSTVESNEEIVLETKRISLEKMADVSYVFFEKLLKLIKRYYRDDTQYSGMLTNNYLSKNINETENEEWVFRNIKDIKNYFKKVFELNCLCIISSKDDCSKEWKQFCKLSGVKSDCAPKKRGGLIIIYDNGKKIFDKISAEAEKITWQGTLNSVSDNANSENGSVCVKMSHIFVQSEGYRRGLEENRVLINNYDYSLNRRGLNIVVVDKSFSMVLDVINIDTYSKDMEIVR